MIRLVLFALLSTLAHSQYPSQYPFAPSTTPAPVHPSAQIHYVNIGQELAGDYKFGYDTGKGPLGQSFREEARLSDGSVKGAYGYVDTSGEQRIVRYSAGKHGFSIDSDEPVGGAKPPAQPAPAFATTTQHNPALTRYLTPPQQIPVPQPAQTPVSLPSPASAQLAQPAAPSYNPASVQLPPPPPPPSPPAAPPASAQASLVAPQPATYSNPTAAQAPYSGSQAPQFRLPALPQPPTPALNFPSSPSFSAPVYQSRQVVSPQSSTGTPLSAFPDLPGVKLIQINRRPTTSEASNYPPNLSSNFASNLASNFQSASAQAFQPPASFGTSTPSSTPAPEEYGPVVINAALLSYDIGTAKRHA